MDIKLKNKKSILICFLVVIYMLAITYMSFIDIMNKKSYLTKDPYFNSIIFRDKVMNYFENVKVLVKNYQLYSKEENNKKYIRLKEDLDKNKAFRYYIEDKNTVKVYTNIKGLININDYVKDKALYNWGFLDKNLIKGNFKYINTWARENKLSGNIILLKEEESFTQIHRDYKYYNSIKTRLVKEIIIGTISFAIGIFLILYLIKYKGDRLDFIENIIKKYDKVPIDIRIFLLINCSIAMFYYSIGINFFSLPIKIKHLFKLSFIATYIFYILINIKSILIIIKNKDERKLQWRKSVIYNLKENIKDSFKIKNTISKVSIIYFLNITIGFVLFKNYNSVTFLIVTTCILLYIIIIPYYILEKTAMINKIIIGTEEIVSGNLNYTIEEKGKGNLSKLCHNINNMKESFKKSVESQVKSERLKSELITNVSHDLKTPLTSIINYVDLLKTENLSKEETLAYIKILDQKSQRLKILIDDLFEASKMASGSVEFEFEKVDITAILRQSLGEFHEKIKESSLAFRVNIPKGGIYSNLDGKKTWRVFENLITNILKYSMKNTRVYIDLKQEYNKAIITMKNISAYEMDFDVEEIFERFKRGDKARSTDGSGLGLAIAKSIVELQGGNMNIDIDGDLFKVIIEFHLLNG